MHPCVARVACLLVLLGVPAAGAEAQPLGTFRWQLQPFCNIVTVSVTQNGGIYRLEGTDDRCGAAQAASVIGTAFVNPDGSIGIGMNVVTAPDGQPLPVFATLSLSTLSGTWRDEAGHTGPFAFAPVAGTGGGPRPIPPPVVIPPAINLRADGGLLAVGAGAGTIPASGPGTRLMWYPGKAAFRAGNIGGAQWDEVNVGLYSTAFGLDAVASGNGGVAAGQRVQALGTNSVALGVDTIASGVASTAMGSGTTASGGGSTAVGVDSTASGLQSTAIGFRAQATGGQSLAAGHEALASGLQSVALGRELTAGGNGSVVLGSHAFTNANASGTFIFADRSTAIPIGGFAPNEFIVRAAGGVGFYTNAGLTTGVEMAAGGSSWAPLSDANMKENFRDVDGEDLLGKLARIPIREWNYKTQEAGIRHMGPTAQDFRAAFGLGDFPLRINTVDADGVALARSRRSRHARANCAWRTTR